MRHATAARQALPRRVRTNPPQTSFLAVRSRLHSTSSSAWPDDDTPRDESATTRRPRRRTSYFDRRDYEEEAEEGGTNEQFRRYLRQPRPTPKFDGAYTVTNRVGKCLAFGCDERQTAEAARIIRKVARDWPRLQMGKSNALIDLRATWRARIDVKKKDETWEPETSWGIVPRPFPQPQIVESAVVKFLDHAMRTAPPDEQKKWLRTKKLQRKFWSVESHDIAHPLTAPLYFRSIQFLHAASQKRIRTSQNVIAFTRLYKIEEFDDERLRFYLRVMMWSLKTNKFLTEAEVAVIYKPLKGHGLNWLTKELTRLLDHSDPRVRKELYDLLDAVERLERETWDNPYAVEDYGSASSAQDPATDVLDTLSS
ncbi:hypothetical protein CSOJ01_12143 [Colletotrichum sojae]|uniref:Uncharacterized protein n=1 Tax=Colletotrichum sojae TaxID=2175907 RepID=A0A8H6MMQ7_9PEZI|nr:hypothetical protein CSOJ01_12143 [Colletotrichum sojae]